jgi:hypothetical protein
MYMYAIGYYPHVILLQSISICASASPINYSSPSSLSSCLSAHIHLSLCPYPRVPLVSPCSYACSISSCPPSLSTTFPVSTCPSSSLRQTLCPYSTVPLPYPPVPFPYPTDLLLLFTCLSTRIHLSICPYSPEPLLYSHGHLLQLTLLSYISVLLTHLL